MLFVASAIAAGLVAAPGRPRRLLTSDAWEIGRRTTYELMSVYAMRMAAVFMIATSTILRRTRLAPRWLVASGYVIALVCSPPSASSPGSNCSFPPGCSW